MFYGKRPDGRKVWRDRLCARKPLIRGAQRSVRRLPGATRLTNVGHASTIFRQIRPSHWPRLQLLQLRRPHQLPHLAPGNKSPSCANLLAQFRDAYIGNQCARRRSQAISRQYVCLIMMQFLSMLASALPCQSRLCALPLFASQHTGFPAVSMQTWSNRQTTYEQRSAKTRAHLSLLWTAFLHKRQ